MSNCVMVCATAKDIFGIHDDTECCYNCGHFIQHYTLTPYKREYATLSELCNGHCCYPRIKDRKPMDFCIHFERRGESPRSGMLGTMHRREDKDGEA